MAKTPLYPHVPKRKTVSDYGMGKCPKCRKIYDTSIMKERNIHGFPICPKCKEILEGVRIS